MGHRLVLDGIPCSMVHRGKKTIIFMLVIYLFILISVWYRKRGTQIVVVVQSI